MTTRHWEEDDLIGRLYGVGPEDGHLEECPECAGRWQALLAARQQVLEPPSVAEDLLAAQRRAIRRRVGAPGRRMGWLPYAASAALGAAAVVLLVVLLRGPGPALVPAFSDAELYAEAYAEAVSGETEALAPIHALFEVER
ncbi:MAG TPA: hypothetical protein VLH09_06305 [Bryobacteraceae bacterium]|nr:hypothetical protein [Bryobacteraceae bacterium]